MMPANARRAATSDWRERFIEELGGLVLDNGTPRSVVRVLGWMVVCDPPAQTALSIQLQLTLSAGGVSAAVRMLADTGMVERVAHPGDRHIYYRLRKGSWERALESRFRTVVQLREVAERALEASGGEADHRLSNMRAMYAWFEMRISELLEESHNLDSNELECSGDPVCTTRQLRFAAQ
jgi:DNA-binding transcriptional regulator GbsR (MarR family)